MVCVSPGMLATKVMVAPNSPIALAKPRIRPATTPGSASGSVIVKNTASGGAPSVSAACSRRAVDRLDRQADRPHHQRESPSPPRPAPRRSSGRRSTTPQQLVQRARRTARAGRTAISSSQPVTTGGSTSGRCTRPSISELAGKPPPRQQPGHGDAERQAGQRADRRHFQRQADRRPFLRRKAEPAANPLPLLHARLAAPAGSRRRPQRLRQIRATRAEPATLLQSGSRGSTGGKERFSLRRILVVSQVALSVVLLMGALLFVRSLRNLTTLNAGFQQSGMLDVSVDFERFIFPMSGTSNTNATS